MRCNNCGWENPDTSTVCEKCRATLSRADMAGNGWHGEESESLRGTVSERKVFGGMPEPGVASADGGSQFGSVCPRCGYALRHGVSVCPNCGCRISGVDKPSAPRNTVSTSRPGTVNPYKSAGQEARCFLTPVARDGERETPGEIEFSGLEAVLNRDNTDPGNQTITSREQALMTYEGGSWYIEDKSELRTTFVQAGRKTRLEDGDIILLGNRMFEFKSGR